MTRSTLKATVLIVVGLVLAAVGIVAWLVIDAGREGSNRLEDWIGGRLKAAAGNYLKPRLEFTSLDYRYPRTAVLHDFAMMATGESGEAVPILAAGEVEIEFTEIPRAGRPIRIRQIDLRRPEVQLVQLPEDRLLGFGDLLYEQPQPVDGEGTARDPSHQPRRARHHLPGARPPAPAGDHWHLHRAARGRNPTRRLSAVATHRSPAAVRAQR